MPPSKKSKRSKKKEKEKEARKKKEENLSENDDDDDDDDEDDDENDEEEEEVDIVEEVLTRKRVRKCAELSTSIKLLSPAILISQDIYVSHKTGTNFLTDIFIKNINIPINSSKDFVIATMNEELRRRGKSCKINDFEQMLQVTGIPFSKTVGKKTLNLFLCEAINFPLINENYTFALLPKNTLDYFDLSRGTGANLESLSKTILMDIKYELVNHITQNIKSPMMDLFRNFRFIKNNIQDHVEYFCNQVEQSLREGGPIRSEELTKPIIKGKIILIIKRWPSFHGGVPGHYEVIAENIQDYSFEEDIQKSQSSCNLNNISNLYSTENDESLLRDALKLSAEEAQINAQNDSMSVNEAYTQLVTCRDNDERPLLVKNFNSLFTKETNKQLQDLKKKHEKEKQRLDLIYDSDKLKIEYERINLYSSFFNQIQNTPPNDGEDVA
jgi:hypothetical protein